MSTEKKTWKKEGYEVHHSSRGTGWFCMPSHRGLTLAQGREAMRKAKSEHRFLRLVKVVKNYELISSSQIEKTESEKKDELLNRVKELFKDDPTVHAYQCSYVSMSTLDMSKTQVRIDTYNHLLGFGKCPQSRDFKDPQTKVLNKEAFKAAVKEWSEKVHPADKVKADEIEIKLKAAGISYKRGMDYCWHAFRLA